MLSAYISGCELTSRRVCLIIEIRRFSSRRSDMNAKGIDPRKVSFSDHAVKQIRAKGFTAEQLFGALTDPRDVTVVRESLW